MKLIACVMSVLAFLASTPMSHAAIKTEDVKYKVGEQEFRGYLSYDDAAKEARPGVLVCPEWWGCNDYAKERTRKLAELGYVAFAVDMYGEGKVTSDPKVAGEWSGKVFGDPKALRERAAAGLKVLSSDKRVDASRLAAIGYCMGGTVALELARTGAELKAVVPFHASTISAKDAADNAKIKAKVLVCHGADDGFVQPGEMDKFHEQMRAAKVDYAVVAYGGAVHSFTNSGADKFGIPGVKYNEAADKRSWGHMKGLFEEVFAKR